MISLASLSQRKCTPVGEINPALADFFATPQNQNTEQTYISWVSNKIGKNPVKLSSLKGPEYDRFKSIYKLRIQELYELIEKIQKEGNDKEWAQIFAKAVVHGGEEYIYCGNDKVVVVGWSMIPKEKKEDHIDSTDEEITLIQNTDELSSANEEQNELELVNDNSEATNLEEVLNDDTSSENDQQIHSEEVKETDDSSKITENINKKKRRKSNYETKITLFNSYISNAF